MRRDLCAIGAGLAALASLAIAAPASAELATATPLTYTGAEQPYTVPAGVTWLALTAAGAPGWDTQTNQTGSVGDNDPGYEVYGMLPVMPGQQLFAEVGQAGLASGAATFGGGGAGGTGSQAPGASGGGASDVRTCSMSAASCSQGSSLDSRVIVGGGGGGSGGNTIAPGSPAAADFIAALGGGGCTQGTALSSCATAPVSAGTVVDGGPANTGNATYDMGWLAAGGGGSAGGTPGVLTTSTLGYSGENGCVMSGGVTGATGTFGVGGTGASGNANGGGGGGGGYYGGGSGSSGRLADTKTCAAPDPTGIGTGGGSGSSFLASQLMNTATGNHGSNSGVVTTASVTLQPLISLTAPANGATFTQGQVVDASYDCFTGLNGGEPVDCQGTEQAPGVTTATSVASGAPIDTSTPGQHTFVVKNAWASGPSTIQTLVTYTVTASAPPVITPTGSGTISGVTGKHPKLKLTVAAGKGQPGLAKLVIGPPPGVSFVKRKGLTLSHGSLTVKASPPTASISVTKLAVKLSNGLLRKIRSKKLTSGTFTIEVTDSSGSVTKLSIKVRL